jgi:hypothetical protein
MRTPRQLQVTGWLRCGWSVDSIRRAAGGLGPRSFKWQSNNVLNNLGGSGRQGPDQPVMQAATLIVFVVDAPLMLRGLTVLLSDANAGRNARVQTSKLVKNINVK